MWQYSVLVDSGDAWPLEKDIMNGSWRRLGPQSSRDFHNMLESSGRRQWVFIAETYMTRHKYNYVGVRDVGKLGQVHLLQHCKKTQHSILVRSLADLVLMIDVDRPESLYRQWITLTSLGGRSWELLVHPRENIHTMYDMIAEKVGASPPETERIKLIYGSEILPKRGCLQSFLSRKRGPEGKDRKKKKLSRLSFPSFKPVETLVETTPANPSGEDELSEPVAAASRALMEDKADCLK